MLDSVNLPDKTRITFAKRFALVLFKEKFRVWCILLSVTNTRNRQSVVKTSHKIFLLFHSKNVNFSQSVCFKLFNGWSSRHDKQVKTLTIVRVICHP